MRSRLLAYLPSIMLASNNIWAAYGIKAAPADETFELHTLSSHIERSSAPQPSLVLDTSSSPSPSSAPIFPLSDDQDENETENSSHSTTTFEPAVPAAPAATSTPSGGSGLSTAAIAGLCIGISVIVVLLAYVLLEACVLRKRRRARALRKAVEVVETGTVRGGSVRSEVRSREGFVAEKDGVRVEGEEVWEVEVGRKGMSLPRRVW